MVTAKVLGIAQDGGVPHLGCNSHNCIKFTYRVASVLIEGEKTVLIDATPDITAQIRDMQLDGVLITHLHIGHYIGLLQFGKEVASTHNLPVYCTGEVAEFIRRNRPFSHLVERQNITLHVFQQGDVLEFGDYTIDPFLVPHRNEDGDTTGIEVTAGKKMCYIPDIDYLTNEIVTRIRNSDVVLLDATFYSKSDIRRQEEVPHPPVRTTVAMVGRPSNEFYFTHLNHSNPLLDRSSKEYREVISKGYRVAEEGMIIQLTQ